MITEQDLRLMLTAKDLDWLSNCARRKIGVYIPLPVDNDDASYSSIGGNIVQSTKQCCTRDLGICPAIHAEVNAILNLGSRKYEASRLYIWAEVPCHACLSFIRRQSFIRDIFCLTADSYGVEYPRVLDRKPEIKLREEYATILDLRLHILDREEILEYGILRDTAKQS
jgi:deoxycytidylate deaminase